VENVVWFGNFTCAGWMPTPLQWTVKFMDISCLVQLTVWLVFSIFLYDYSFKIKYICDSNKYYVLKYFLFKNNIFFIFLPAYQNNKKTKKINFKQKNLNF
jgi:accessory gene regulator protein AgrB